MANSNIKLFDENKTNMMADAEYGTNTQRANGVQTGVASSELQNKFQYQMSLMAYAIAQLMLANGKDAMDSAEVTTFVANLSNSIVQKVLDKASDEEASAGQSDSKWISAKQLVAVANSIAGGAAGTKIPKLTEGAGNFPVIAADGTLSNSGANAASFAANRLYPVVGSWDGTTLHLSSWW
jgi:hypothetical protein